MEITRILVGVIGGIVLGVLTNWLYDVCRARGWLPANPSLKRLAVIAVALATFVVLAVWSQSGPKPTPEPLTNRAPTIHSLSVNSQIVDINGEAVVTVNATDPDGDPLTYVWSVSNGDIVEGPTPQSTVRFHAPAIPGTVILKVIARDNNGGEAQESVNIAVVVPAAQ